MKSLFVEYKKIVMYTIFGLIIILSSYTIIINIYHYKSLNNYVVVSDIDTNYLKYMNNVTKFEENINKYGTNNQELFLTLNNVLGILKKSGIFRLVPNTKIKYQELYQLNDYFIEELINKGWVANIKKLDTKEKYKNQIDFLVNNAKYLNNMFTKNGLVLYDDIARDKIIDDYNLILNNYAMYSSIILELIGGYNG